jgi:hypothetical protein
MKMPMVDIGKEGSGGMKAVKADAKSGSGHAPQNAKKSAGPGVSSEGMGCGACGAAVRHLDGMAK